MKRLALFICTLLCANVLSAQTEFIVGNFKYKVTSSNPTEVSVGPVDNTITTANIPATVSYDGTTYSVTSIGNSAFWNCSSLTSVTIPNSVTSIGWWAFKNCSSLTSITIPNSVTSIEGGAFAYCSSLTSIIIPNSVTSIGEQAFSNCSSLTSIDIPNSVTSVGCCVFSYCTNLTSVTIGTGITELLGGGDVYSEGGMTRVGFFSDCSSLTFVTIPNNVTYIGKSAFKNCSSLTSIDIPSSVTSIGGSAFFGCSSLTSIDIPNSVTSIGGAVFQDCSSLTSINIDLPSIGNIFGGCNSLQNITLGENVTSIGSGVFNGCSFLQNVTCLATTPPTLEDNTVFPYPNIATLTVPCGSLEAYSSATSFWNMFFAGRISESGYNVEVFVNDETFGSVAVESDCSTGTLTATANEGYRFVIWNDGNTDNPRTVALTSDTAFTAIFALIDESSLAEDAEFAEISLYPNPTSSKVSFNQTIEKVEVIDLSGKTLFTFSNANSINIESLPSGAYYLRLTNNDKAIMQKIIKE